MFQLEPMAVAMHAVHKVAQMQHAANVLVFGAGPVGLLTCAVAKGLGARQVIAVDVQEARLEFAKEQGLAHDYYVSPKANEGESKLDYSKRCAEEIRQRFGFAERGPSGIDLVVDCSGAEVCIQTGIFALRHGGTLVHVRFNLPPSEKAWSRAPRPDVGSPVDIPSVHNRSAWERPRSRSRFI